MLTRSVTRGGWLAATLAAVTFLAVGLVLAAGLDPPGVPPPVGTAGQAVQPDAEDTGPKVTCKDPNDPDCSVGERRERSGGPPAGPAGPGGDGRCTWTRSLAITVSYAQPTTETIEIPCVHPDYGWFDGDECYWGTEFPSIWPAPEDPPEGASAEDGQWYYGTCLFNVTVFNDELVFSLQAALFRRWFEFSEVPVVTPQMVVQEWLATVPLHGVEIRLAPPESGAGLVDLPVWLGVDRTGNTFGPLTDSDCIGGVCVSIQAQVTQVEWDMGDGTVVTCAADQHRAWRPGDPFLSPGDNCHHYYRRASRGQPDGRYQITATSTWAVHWESDVSDVSGDLEVIRTSGTSIRIDEIQVLTGGQR